MIESGELLIHYTEIPKQIKTYFGEKIKDQHELDTWDFDLRSQTFLHRNAAGYYEFAHKSLAEYFVALKFAAELGCLPAAYAQAYCEADGQPCSMPFKQSEISVLAGSFGSMPLIDERLRKTVTSFLVDMLDEDATARLWQIVNATKEKQPELVKYVGGNTATLLGLKDESFVDGELANAVLTGANLYNVDLTGINMHGAYLREAVLVNTILERSDFRLADLQEAIIEERHTANNLAWSTSGVFLAGIMDHKFRIWSVADCQQVFSKDIEAPWLDQDILYMPCEDGFIFADGNELLTIVLRNGRWNMEANAEFEYPIKYIAQKADTDLVAVSQENRIVIWNYRTRCEHTCIEYGPR